MSAIAIDLSSEGTFKKLFQLCPKNYRTIFEKLHWGCNTLENVYFKLETIAEMSKCSISTVKRAIKYFCDMGWLDKRRRAYQSSIYRIPDELLNLNLKDCKIFNRKKPQFSQESELIGEPVLFRSRFSYPKYSCYSAEKARIAWKAAEKTAPNTNFEDLDDQTQNDLKIVYPKELIDFVLDKIDWYRKQPGKVVDKFVGLMKFLCDKHLKEFC